MNSSLNENSLGPADRRASHNARLPGNFIFFSLLALIAFVAVPYGTVEPWWNALFECAVFGLAALWLLEGFLSGSWRFSNYYLFWPLLTLTLLAFVQTLPISQTAHASLSAGGETWASISADPHGTRQWIARMLALILVGAMLQRYTSDRRRLLLLAYLVVGIALASALFGLLRQATQTEAGFILPNLYPSLGFAQFINKNHFAFLIEMAVGLCLGFIVWGGLPKERLLAVVGVLLLLAAALVVANSRGGIFSLFCQLLFAALFFTAVRPIRDSRMFGGDRIHRVRRFATSVVVRALLLICFTVVVAIGIVWVGGGPLAGNLEAIPSEVGAPSGSVRWAARRWDIWPATWNLIKAHPVAGVGFGGYWMAITAYHDASGEMTPQEAHNDYLEFLASGGLIGVAIGIWFLYGFIRILQRRLLTSDKLVRAARCGAIVGLAGVAIHSIVDFGLHITINAVVSMVLLVIATADVDNDRQTVADE